MVTMRILQLAARTMPSTNAGVVTVQFPSFFSCNRLAYSIKIHQVKSSNPPMERNPRTKEMRGKRRVIQKGKSVPLLNGGVARQKQGLSTDACLPTGPENPRVLLCLSLGGEPLKKNKRQLRGNTHAPAVCIRQTVTLSSQPNHKKVKTR